MIATITIKTVWFPYTKYCYRRSKRVDDRAYYKYWKNEHIFVHYIKTEPAHDPVTEKGEYQAIWTCRRDIWRNLVTIFTKDYGVHTEKA